MTIAFVDGPVITGTGQLLENATVVVENDRISKVTEGDVSVPPDAKKIPMDGMTLLPGFIDAHVHICIDGSPDPVSTMLAESQTETTLKAAEAGTGIAARVLGLENDLGTIEEGKLADLILVAGNPLENIDILLERESICLVMQGGKVVTNDLA